MDLLKIVFFLKFILLTLLKYAELQKDMFLQSHEDYSDCLHEDSIQTAVILCAADLGIHCLPKTVCSIIIITWKGYIRAFPQGYIEAWYAYILVNKIMQIYT